MIKKIFAFIISLTLILTMGGCYNDSSQTKKTDKIEKKSLKIMSSVTHDKETVKALDIFAKKLSEGDSSFIAEYSIEKNPIEEIKKGNCQIAIADSKLLEKYGKNFSLFTTPFYFANPEQSIMIFNSEKFEDLFGEYFEESIGCSLLGSVYLSTDFMLFTKGDLRNLKSDKKKKAILSDNESTAAVFFEKNGFKVNLDNLNKLDFDVNGEDEEDNGEIYIMNINEIAKSFEKNTILYTPKSPFRISSQWILVDTDFWNGLCLNEQKEIKNGLSYFCGASEPERLYEYSELYYNLLDYNITLQTTNNDELINQMKLFVKSDYINDGTDLYNGVLNIIGG